MKRRALLIALLALVLLLLTGCGSTKTASAPVESTLPVENAQPVTNQTGAAIISDAVAEPVSVQPDDPLIGQWDDVENSDGMFIRWRVFRPDGSFSIVAYSVYDNQEMDSTNETFRWTNLGNNTYRIQYDFQDDGTVLETKTLVYNPDEDRIYIDGAVAGERHWSETLNDDDYAREAALYASGAYDNQSNGLTYAGSGQFFVMTKTEGDGTSAKFSRQELSAFPSDFPDNYSWGTDIVLLDKYLEIGDVGCEPRILAQFTWLGKSYTISVPSVPSLLKAYAEENGYNIVKIFVESNSDMAAIENAMNNCVFFYTGTIRTVLEYAAPTEYTLEWSTISFVPSTLFCSPGIIDKKVPFNVAYSQLQYSSFSYKASDDQILLYPQGSWAFWPNDPTFGTNPGTLTITYTQTGLEMSNEEAAWLVNYMQGVNIHYGQPNSALLSDPNFNVSETY